MTTPSKAKNSVKKHSFLLGALILVISGVPMVWNIGSMEVWKFGIWEGVVNSM